VSKRQEGNPLLKHMKNVRWQWADIVPDYQMGLACALFLSLRCEGGALCAPPRRGAGRRPARGRAALWWWPGAPGAGRDAALRAAAAVML
jgi:hypothetical protein